MNEFKIKNGLVVEQGPSQITGSLLISGSTTISGSLTVTEGITGSLEGTASFATNALTASYVESATGANITGSFTDQSTWTFVHGLGNQGVVVQAYDTSWNQILPQSITLTDSNTATVTFPSSQSGYVIATLGGTTSLVNAVSASYAVSASNIPLDTVPTSGSSNAVSSNGVFDALALKQDKVIKQGYTQLTGVTGANVVASLLIPANWISSGDGFEIFIQGYKLNTGVAIDYKIYHDTVVNGISNGIATNIAIASSQRANPFQRIMSLSGTTLYNNMLVNATSTVPIPSTNITTTTFDSTVDNYITLTVSPTLVSESCGFTIFYIRKI